MEEGAVDGFPYALSDSLRWVAPLTGAVLMFLAWRRFRVAGAGQAALGFALILANPVFRSILSILQRVWIERRMIGEFRATDFVVVAIGAELLTIAGAIMLVLAMRRMIADAGPITLRNRVWDDR